jgi:hypothetical protein
VKAICANHAGFKWIHIEIADEDGSAVALVFFPLPDDFRDSRAFQSLARFRGIQLAGSVRYHE